MIVINLGRDDTARPNLEDQKDLLDASSDRLTRLAARILKVPVALISLSERTRGGASFKAEPGLRGSCEDRPEKRIAQSLCRRVIEAAQMLAVADMRTEPSAEAGAVKVDPEFIAFLGIPLRISDGCVLGAFCVFDRVPRVWTDEDIQDLDDLGEIAARHIAGLKAAEEISRGRSDSLNGIDRRGDEFMSILGHELRSPLAAILSAVHLAREAGMDAEEINWSHGIIERQATQLVRLLDDLFDVSRIAQGKVQLRKQPVELADIVGRATAAVRRSFERKNHELVVSLGEEPLRLDADPTRVEQILVNLLNNAAKYSDEGGRIVLKAERSGGEAVMAVSDTGMGISSEMLPHVFDLFPQVPGSPERAQGGLGVGLTLAKMLAEMHGGNAEAASPGPGKGSEFSVRLPLREDAPATKAEVRMTASGDASAGLRILVVDDNVDSAMSMAMVLKVSGHQVRTAYDGDAAIDVAFDQCPDAILLDIGLPVRDGYEVAEILRRDARCRDIFIVALSGYGQDEDRRRSRAAGFDAHLVKPVDVDELLKMLADPRRAGRTAGTD